VVSASLYLSAVPNQISWLSLHSEKGNEGEINVLRYGKVVYDDGDDDDDDDDDGDDDDDENKLQFIGKHKRWWWWYLL